jgi:hypothetical protein
MNRPGIVLLLKIFLLVVPVSALTLAFPLAVLVASGEIGSIRKVISLQKEPGPVLLGLAYSYPTRAYKLESIIERRPAVVSLGTSRVMEIRSGFFRIETTHYNAGGGVTKIEDLQSFLAAIPRTNQPKLIILGLDQNFFNSAWDNSISDDQALRPLPSLMARLDIVLNTWHVVYRDYWMNKFSLNVLMKRGAGTNCVGIQAIVNSHGFRNDGSLRYNPNYLLPGTDTSARFRSAVEAIKTGNSFFVRGTDVSAKSIAELTGFLRACRDRGIYVVGFLPPYPHFVAMILQSMSQQYSYLFKIGSIVEPVFKSFDFRFYDFSDAASIGASDRETLDGIHCSEKAYLRLFIKMVKTEEHLAKYAKDPEYLEHLLINAPDEVNVLGDEPFCGSDAQNTRPPSRVTNTRPASMRHAESIVPGSNGQP